MSETDQVQEIKAVNPGIFGFEPGPLAGSTAKLIETEELFKPGFRHASFPFPKQRQEWG